MSPTTARDILEDGLGWHGRCLHRPLIDELLGTASSETGADRWVTVLRDAVAREVRSLGAARQLHADHQQGVQGLTRVKQLRQATLDFARDLEPDAPRGRQRGDTRALRRAFDFEAVEERSLRRQQRSEQRLAFFLERLGAVAGHALTAVHGDSEVSKRWQRYGLCEVVGPFLPLDRRADAGRPARDHRFDGDPRVAVAACRCLAQALGSLEPEQRALHVPRALRRSLERAAGDSTLDVWLQCEAIELLAELAPELFCRVVIERLRSPRKGDDLFVRRRAVMAMGRRLETLPQLTGLVTVVLTDPSPYVRQGLAETLSDAPEAVVRQGWRHLARIDRVPQVRAAALLQADHLLTRPELHEDVLAVLASALEDGDDFVVRTVLHVAVESHRRLCRLEDGLAKKLRRKLLPAIGKLHRGESGAGKSDDESSPSTAAIPVRRWAAESRERLLCDADPAAASLLAELRRLASDLTPGDSCSLPAKLLDGWDENRLGRVMAVLAQDDFGIDFEPARLGIAHGGRLTRGPVFGFRIWRLLHELRHPAPDKRQGHRHTIGRVHSAPLRAPSAKVADLAQTRVPGEPLMIREEGGWRPYLPLVDDFLSTLSPLRRRPVRLFTAEGVTLIKPPRGLLHRLRARWILEWRFADFAALRDWRADGARKPTAYLDAMRKLGFEIHFEAHRDADIDESGASPDPAVEQFFPAFAGLGFGLWEPFQDYFFSAYQNTLGHLTVFLVLTAAIFAARHLWHGRRLRRARRRLPLVIGGWGTRGKSGTERLKAALFNALGQSVVSKTTGCEAMILQADAFGSLRELFLYRPYDKATIWEQSDTTRLASKLSADVMLWECMGLTPAYVDVLQRQWMRDDLSTITNTYPDHEDIQGPAGLDVARSISAFVPRSGRLISSEEVMAPVLRDEARRHDTTIRSTGWLEAGLLTDDVTGRLPYDEHPSNLALVLAMADELDIPRDFAIKEMADRVVPDLGVLKTYPAAEVHGRQLEFTNGCSANERLATLNNWRRLGFDRHDPAAEPGVWIVTVVNNRADRVARSRVFAEMLVRDLAADAHVLIGTNLEGLRGYIEDAWNDYAANISLWRHGGSPSAALETLDRLARRHRLPASREAVTQALGVMLGDVCASQHAALLALWQDPSALGRRLAELGEPLADDVETFHARQLATFRKLHALQVWIAAQTDVPTAERQRLDDEVRALLWRHFESKLHVVEDPHTPGEAIVERTVRATPPHFWARVMGVMNIKGTGLDHVYRWQAWESCYDLCQKLGSNDPSTTRTAAYELARFHEFGLLSEATVRGAVDSLERGQVADLVEAGCGPDVILTHLDTQMETVQQNLLGRSRSRLKPLLDIVESFLDLVDGLWRRHRAERIYRDLAAERIATRRAAEELKALVERQKGGWLGAWLQTRVTRVASSSHSLKPPKTLARPQGSVALGDA